MTVKKCKKMVEFQTLELEMTIDSVKNNSVFYFQFHFQCQLKDNLRYRYQEIKYEQRPWISTREKEDARIDGSFLKNKREGKGKEKKENEEK